MKRFFFIMFCTTVSHAACPLYTYPENHKLDQEVNNTCQKIQNPVGNNLNYSSGTFRYLSVTSATINNLTINSTSTIFPIISINASIPAFGMNRNASTGSIFFPSSAGWQWTGNAVGTNSLQLEHYNGATGILINVPFFVNNLGYVGINQQAANFPLDIAGAMNWSTVQSTVAYLNSTPFLIESTGTVLLPHAPDFGLGVGTIGLLTPGSTSNNLGIGYFSDHLVSSNTIDDVCEGAFSCQNAQGNDSIHGSDDTGFGDHALSSLTTGYFNNAFGSSAMSSSVWAYFNSCFGTSCMQNDIQSVNCNALGDNTLVFLSTASADNAVGVNAGRFMTNGSLNNLFGFDAGEHLSSGSYNSLFGDSSGLNMDVGYGNTCAGTSSCYYTTNGFYNTQIGFNAYSGTSTVHDCIIVGANSQCSGNGDIIIGDGFIGTGTNQLYLGSPVGTGVVTTNISSMTTTGSANFGGVVTFQAQPVWNTALKAPTMQKFTSGSGTYITPTNPSPLYIRVRMVGGGGGGGGSATVAAANGVGGGTGGNTTFGTSLLVANGGVGGGANASAVASAGGTASLGSANGNAVSGGQGNGVPINLASGIFLPGGSGGNTPWGGAGGGNPNAAGQAGATNTGAGGSGGGTSNAGPYYPGAGGAGGGYVNALIVNLSATYSYAVGAAGTAGTAGTGGNNGGAGSNGFIEVDEFYQ